ncbi:MAG: NAD(P)/FAD-dependent oxidoreductase [Bacteroidetes bacterium]|nr:NAD(P)/FAD-dependent oxidoreductase [Bacteroidota bacterium]
MSTSDKYDVVIIGSGLGGLLCGAILSKEGQRVCILEKNEQIGGALQTFRRDGLSLDTGIHYIGGLDKGQNLYQIFHYLGITDRLELTKLDEHGFDNILFKDDTVVYPHGMGYESFVTELSAIFPDEKNNIEKYCSEIKKVCDTFALYNLNAEEQYDDINMLSLSAKAVIESLTPNIKLQAVLAGSNMLYAGVGEKTPWYVHALIINSYIQSSYRCTKGGDQIAKLLAREIKANGGEIHTKMEIVRIQDEDGSISYVETKNGNKIYGERFISNVHPAVTLDMLASEAIRPVYKNRIKGLANSVSSFVLNVVMRPDQYKYQNRNYYYFDDTNVWETTHTDERWPRTYGIFEAVPHSESEYVESLSIMTYMEWDEVKEWQATENTSIYETNRGDGYEDFKNSKAEKLLAKVAEKFPDLVKNIESWYAATPLTYRDYLHTPDGSIYGVAKDAQEPIKTMISPNTKIPNLYMTGQNIKLHGVLGVALTALVTCSMILGRDYLINKIKEANETAA